MIKSQNDMSKKKHKKCYRCENKSYTWCKSCVDASNFKDAWTDEEYKEMRRKRKDET